MPTMDVELEALTPLYTVDERMQLSEIHPTALLGYLRIWLEWIWAGGGWEPGDPKAALETAKARGKDVPNLKRMSPTSLLFGCTGWQRRLRMTVKSNLRPSSNRDYYRNRKPAGGFTGKFRIGFASLGAPAGECKGECPDPDLVLHEAGRG